MNKKILLGMITCVLLLTVGLMTACDGGKTPADTPADTNIRIEMPTEGPTDTPVEVPTEEVTEATTEATTETTTEVATTEEVTTEAETDDGIPLNELTIGGVDIKNYTLVVQEGGADCVRDSANELIEYIEKATGACQEHAISLNTSPQ